MRMFFVVLALLLGSSAQAYEQTLNIPETPDLRVVLGPDAALATTGYVEGQLVLRVQLVSRFPFEALTLKTPSVPDADVIELLRPRTRKVSSYAGEGYVFETSIAIIPRRSGILTVPPVTAVGVIEPEPGRDVQFDLASEPVDVKVSGISPHYNDRDPDARWLVAHRVEIDEDWSIPVEEIRVGEIVQRRIKLRVWGTTAERLPVLEHPRTRGIRVSLAGMETATEKSPDGLIATADYVWNLEADPQQVAFVAPVGLPYWTPLEHRRLKAGVPGYRLEPLPADSAAIAARLMNEAETRQAGRHLAGFAIAGVLLTPVVLFVLALLGAWLPSRADRRLRTVCKPEASARAVYQALERWSIETGETPDGRSTDQSARSGLLRHLFAPGHPEGVMPPLLAKQALRHSRSLRLASLFRRVRSTLALGEP